LGSDYTALISSWIELERAKDWRYSPKGISPKNRPKELSFWITNCRYDRRNNDPKFRQHDLDHFTKNFMTWWNTLQPSWRLDNPHLMPGQGSGSSFGMEWGTLDTSGKNGWLSVIVCLKWWGIGLGDDRESALGDEWRGAVEDVLFMLNGLISVLSQNN
ncbi:hypothetical protein F5050DRAFT_1579320, partial [Lentinula boryana]